MNKILGLDPEASDFTVVYEAIPRDCPRRTGIPHLKVQQRAIKFPHETNVLLAKFRQ